MPKANPQSVLSAEAGLLGRRSSLPFTESSKVDALARRQQRQQTFSFDSRWLSVRHPYSAPIIGLRISPMNIPMLRSISKKSRKGDLVEKLGLQSEEGPVSPRERRDDRGTPGHMISPQRVRSEAMSAAPIFAQPAKLRRNKTEIIFTADSSLGDIAHKSRSLAKKTAHSKLKGDAKVDVSEVGRSHSHMSELGALHKHGSTPALLLGKSESSQGNSKSRQGAGIASKYARRECPSSSELDKLSKRKPHKRQPLEGKKRARSNSGKTMPTEQAGISRAVAQVKDGQGTGVAHEISHAIPGQDEAIANKKNEEKIASLELAVNDFSMTFRSGKESPRHRGRKLRKKKRGAKSKNAETPSGGRDSTSMPEVTPHDGEAAKYLQENNRARSSPRAMFKKAPAAQVKAKEIRQGSGGGRNKQPPSAHVKEFPLFRVAGSELPENSPGLFILPPDPNQTMIAKVEVARIEEERKSKRSPRKSRKTRIKRVRQSVVEISAPNDSPRTESLHQEDVTFRYPQGKRSLSSPCKEKASHQTAATGEAGASEEKSPAVSVSQSSGMSRCKTMSEIMEILCKHLDGNKNKQSLEMLPVQLRQYCAQNAERRPSSLPGLPKTYQQLGLKPLVRSMSSENFFPRLTLQWRSDKHKKRRRPRASRTASAGGGVKTPRRGKEEKQGKAKARKKKSRS